jgi:diacylglycerol kinase
VDMELRDQNKKMGITRLINSFKYSFQGLVYAYTKEQSMTIHLSITLGAVAAGLFFNISIMEWLFILLLIGLVVATELINTSIEATIDLISPSIHPLAKIAKDTASAAVFALSTVAFVGGILIFVPKIIDKFF